MIKLLAREAWRASKSHLLNVNDHTTYAKRFQKMRKLGGLPVSITYDQSTSLFVVEDTDQKIHVARRPRLEFQIEGIEVRQQTLFDEYTGGHVTLNPGDVVLDCGANIGEFSLHCLSRQPDAQVFSFEPDPTEFRALSENALPNMTLLNTALWNSSGAVDFYDKNDSGDSSLLDPGGAAQKISVEARRLDELAADHPTWSQIKLFKLEAEGAEPEILEGAGALLDNVAFISVDMGPERGLTKANTVCETVNYLYQRGFEMVFFKDGRNAGLFRNTQLAI